MSCEAFADLLFVSGNDVGTGCGVVVRVEFMAGTNDDVGEWGVFADMLKDRDGRLVMRNGDDNRLAFAQASVFKYLALHGVANLAVESELFCLSHALAIQ